MSNESKGWYRAWVKVYAQAVAANADAVAALLAIERIVLHDWRAAREELDECADRLIRARRVPKFANEHSDAIGNELVRLRDERRAARALNGDFAADCPACGGSGLAVVPVRACVWQGQLVLHPEYQRVLTGGVICDRPGCEAGAKVLTCERARNDDKPRRPKLSQCERATSCDLVALLRNHERVEAKVSREEMAERGETVDPYSEFLRKIVDRAKNPAPLEDDARDAA